MLFMPPQTEVYAAWEVIDNLLNLAAAVCLIILAFKVRRILIQHYDENMGMNIGFSGVATFFLGELYLQYKINRLPIADSLNLTESRM